MSLTTGRLDYQNRYVLADYAKKVERKHIIPLYDSTIEKGDKKEKSIWKRIKNWLPKPWLFGQYAGWIVGETFSQQITNNAIEKTIRWTFADKLAAEAAAKTKASMSDRFLHWFKKDVAQPGLVEATKLVLTPKIAPFVTIGLGFAGGITATATVMLIEYLIAAAIGKRLKDVTIRDLHDVQVLIHQKKGQWRLGNKSLSENSLKNISYRINQYTLCQQLQRMNKEEIEPFIRSQIILREDNKQMLKDGYLLSKKKEKIIHQSILLLKQDNPTRERKAIKQCIRLFSRHLFIKKNDGFIGSIVKCKDGYYQLPDVSKGQTQATKFKIDKETIDQFISKQVIIREDRKHIWRDGKFVNKEEEKKLEDAIRIIKEEDPPQYDATLSSLVSLISKHAPLIKNDPFEDSIVKCADGYYQLPDQAKDQEFVAIALPTKLVEEMRSCNLKSKKMFEEFHKKELLKEQKRQKNKKPVHRSPGGSMQTQNKPSEIKP